MLLKLLLTFTSAKIGNNCGESPTDTIYVSTIDDVESVGSCSVVNASVFIHGENNIGSLSDLNGINQINGDLVITDTTEIRNLKGLHNLARVNGEDLYLDQYAVVITDNTRLAYIDTINWTSITDYPTDFRNNADVSVVCDPFVMVVLVLVLICVKNVLIQVFITLVYVLKVVTLFTATRHSVIR